MTPSIKCPLCRSQATPFDRYQGREYYQCANCHGISLSALQLPDFQEEKHRYEQHENDVNDPGYLRFAKPMVEAVMRKFGIDKTGLDFGSGTISATSFLLRNENYQVHLYDPFFQNNPETLTKKYDFITCCEVVEHFHYPEKEFQLLYNCLHPGGVLFIMTDLFDEKIDFQKWYYKNDFTHVFFYQSQTFHWIKQTFNFREIAVENRLVCLTK